MQVLVIGADGAGMAAAEAAQKLGAIVRVVDKNGSFEDSVEGMGAAFVHLGEGLGDEGWEYCSASQVCFPLKTHMQC